MGPLIKTNDSITRSPQVENVWLLKLTSWSVPCFETYMHIQEKKTCDLRKKKIDTGNLALYFHLNQVGTFLCGHEKKGGSPIHLSVI